MTAAPPEQAWFAQANQDLEVVQRNDEAQFDGRFPTHDLILTKIDARATAAG